ncbi:hypothetical protein DFP72DRAFT_853279 [Ephemerocybe angulata]|uniref:Uncharacterized protein n=1 Tax=Ephemerocybe angulata TaxID=980116 RepID=A0A8H6HKD2_9AGAR|nr:hypothetical protein DFP72DRAFT_853279 [Tulosesus angulatus]
MLHIKCFEVAQQVIFPFRVLAPLTVSMSMRRRHQVHSSGSFIEVGRYMGDTWGTRYNTWGTLVVGETWGTRYWRDMGDVLLASFAAPRLLERQTHLFDLTQSLDKRRTALCERILHIPPQAPTSSPHALQSVHRRRRLRRQRDGFLGCVWLDGEVAEGEDKEVVGVGEDMSWEQRGDYDAGLIRSRAYLASAPVTVLDDRWLPGGSPSSFPVLPSLPHPRFSVYTVGLDVPTDTYKWCNDNTMVTEEYDSNMIQPGRKQEETRVAGLVVYIDRHFNGHILEAWRFFTSYHRHLQFFSMDRATPQREVLARRLLANASSGEVPHLRALAHAYPHHYSDLRPVETVIPFLRIPPAAYPALCTRPSNKVDLRPVLQALVSIEVIQHAGHAVTSDSNATSCGGLSGILERDWPYIILWITYTLEYSEFTMPPESLHIPMLIVAQFLTEFTQTPFSPTIMGNSSTTIDLAFRVWCGEFNKRGPLGKATPAMLEFFSNCLDNGASSEAVLHDHFQDLNQAESFFKSCTMHFSDLADDSTAAGASRILQIQETYAHMMESLARSMSGNAVWKWSIKKGTGPVLRGPLSAERWKLAQVASLIAMAEDVENGIVRKIVQLIRAASSLIVGTYLQTLSAYLPYPLVSRAVAQSLEDYFHDTGATPLPSEPSWLRFWSTLKITAHSSAAQSAFYTYACDNINSVLNGVTPNSLMVRLLAGTFFHLGGHVGVAKPFFTALMNARGRIGKRFTGMNVRALQICYEVLNNPFAPITVRRENKQWFPWGSEGNLGAVLVHYFNLMYLRESEEAMWAQGMLSHSSIGFQDLLRTPRVSARTSMLLILQGGIDPTHLLDLARCFRTLLGARTYD